MLTAIKMPETATPAAFTLAVFHPPATAQLAVLQVKGSLDRLTYEPFIDRAAGLYAQGMRRLLIDLRLTTHVELSGLFALHNVARLYGGERLFNSKLGWTVLHAASQPWTAAMQAGVKLLAPPPVVAQAIESSSFCRFLEVYDDLMPAMASFGNHLPVSSNGSLLERAGGSR